MRVTFPPIHRWGYAAFGICVSAISFITADITLSTIPIYGWTPGQIYVWQVFPAVALIAFQVVVNLKGGDN